MADPRFYDNRGRIALAELCAKVGAAAPAGTASHALVHDVAGLAQAGPQHLSFFDSNRARDDFTATKAGWCLIRDKAPPANPAANTVLLPCASVLHAFAAAAKLFYPEHGLDIRAQDKPVHPTAKLGEGVVLSPGVIIGPNVEIGERTRIGANAVIGRGVTIGRDGKIGANAWIGFAHLGDEVVIFPGAQIGAPGFSFASSASGHVNVPQLGRVILQDRVEVGANATIDRGALGDTVIGEGTKIDNLVQIAHNCIIGRHCVIAALTGIAGSVTLGDFVVVGGKVGFADHVTIGAGARFAGLSGITRDLPGGQDYGGIPARPVKEWIRELALLSKLAKERKRTTDE
jgi:UDP-3-O-[3-hydroxymyristoyl] glucosamine N-acyltransferase